MTQVQILRDMYKSNQKFLKFLEDLRDIDNIMFKKGYDTHKTKSDMQDELVTMYQLQDEYPDIDIEDSIQYFSSIPLLDGSPDEKDILLYAINRKFALNNLRRKKFEEIQKIMVLFTEDTEYAHFMNHAWLHIIKPMIFSLDYDVMSGILDTFTLITEESFSSFSEPIQQSARFCFDDLKQRNFPDLFQKKQIAVTRKKHLSPEKIKEKVDSALVSFFGQKPTIAEAVTIPDTQEKIIVTDDIHQIIEIFTGCLNNTAQSLTSEETSKALSIKRFVKLVIEPIRGKISESNHDIINAQMYYAFIHMLQEYL